MAQAANLLSDPDIDASNVRPAFEAALRAGVPPETLCERLGWTREGLERDGAVVSGTSTYAHMEMMWERPGYAAFVLDAVSLHTLASLGVVGLACKTSATVGEAIASHRRFQHLTNRTARYEGAVDGDAFVFTEHRYGEPRLGSLLISDYTLLVALQLLRGMLEAPLRVVALDSRRTAIPNDERALIEAFAGAPLRTESSHARLVLGAEVLAMPIPNADSELAAHFATLLGKAAPPEPDVDPLVAHVRDAISARLSRGTPSALEVATELALGERTLQRRLAALGLTFGEVLAEIRSREAERYLANPRLSLAEVSYLLGYTEQASFFRAFRRWHDMTPSTYRDGLS